MERIGSRSSRGASVVDDGAVSRRPRGEVAESDESRVTAHPALPPLPVVSGRPARSRRRWLRIGLMSGGILVVAAVAGIFWLRGGRYVSTDDAYVHASKLMVTTDVSGIVSAVEVLEGQAVKTGDVLFRVDPRQFEIALSNAKANLAQTALAIEAMKHDYTRMLSDIAAQQAQVDLDQTTYERYASLVMSDVVSRANFDQARFALEADRNRLVSLRRQATVQLTRLDGDPDIRASEHPQYLQAKAQVEEAQRQLDHSVVRAPYDGIVTQVDALQPGTYSTLR